MKIPYPLYSFFLLFSVLTVLFVSTCVWAAPAKDLPKRINVDGVALLEDEVLLEFLRAAYPGFTFFDDPNSVARRNFNPQTMMPREHWGASPPSLLEYVFRKNGRPKFDSLSRWEQDISIGVGVPFSNTRAVDKAFFETVKEALPFLAAMKEHTGRNVKLLAPNEESADAFAKIRIIPLDHFPIQNKFKRIFQGRQPLPFPVNRGEEKSDLNAFDKIDTLEQFFTDAIRFTPRTRAQVDGYYLTNKDNEIELAVCYVWMGHSDQVKRALIKECVLRSMGMPEQTIFYQRSSLSPWNKAYDPYSLLPVLDPERAKPDARIMIDSARVEGSDVLKSPHYDEIFPAKLDNKSDLPTEMLTDFERVMLRLLYCKDLSAGLSRYEVIRRFSQGHMQCLD